MIRGIFGRRAAGGAEAQRSRPDADSPTAGPAHGVPAAAGAAGVEGEDADQGPLAGGPPDGSLIRVSATAEAARRHLTEAIEIAAAVTAVLDRLSRFNDSIDIEFVTYLDGRLADIRGRVSRLAAGLADEERALGEVAQSLVEINERRVDVDEARLASVRVRTAAFRQDGSLDRQPDLGPAQGPSPAPVRRGWWPSRSGERVTPNRLGRGIRALALPVALLLAVALVDAGSAASLSPQPVAAVPTTGVDRDVEFLAPAGDDHPATPAAARSTAAPTAAVVEVTAAPTDPPPAPVAAPPDVAARVAFHGPTDRPVVALTFDDGWSGKNGRAVLDILLSEQVPATFFLNGVYLAGNQQLWRDIADAGFPVANHTYRHQDVTTLTGDEVVADLQRNAAAFEAVTGHQMVPLFRPPYGNHNATSDAAAALAGYPDVVLWNATDDDTVTTTDARRIARGSAGGAGAIVLLHIGPDPTPRILEQIIANYRARGYGFVTVTDLLYPAG